MKRIHAVFVLVAILAFALSGSIANAQERPFLHPLFARDMVLQRDRVVPIWGWTQPGQQVTVSIAGKTARATADTQGKWMAKIGPLPAGGPHTLTVSGPQTVTLENVLVGDVWICSGQSNMEMGIGNVYNAEQEIASANYPQIRLFTVNKTIALEPRSDLSKVPAQLMGQWSVCTPETVRTGGWNGFSAVGYFFGRTLHEALKIPIGLIHTSWGGTLAEAWTSAEALQTMEDFRPAVAQLADMRADLAHGTDSYAQRLAAWWEKNDPGSASGAGWEQSAFDASAWKSMTLPTNWEDAGLPDYDGVVWFRREVELPASADGKEAILHLGPIDDMDTTWVNGTKVGGLNVYNQPRDYKVPAGVLKAGRNVIAVRVLDTGGAGGINGKPDDLHLDIAGEQPMSLAGSWSYKDSAPLAKTTPAPQPFNSNPNIPTVLYNGMIAPLVPFGIKGAIWYQGEANAGKAYQYRTLLPTMIKDWRTRWGEGDFPFYIVQLANFLAVDPEPKDDAWPELREAQLMTAENVPHSGLAVAIDIGDAQDIHPKNKQEVGRRLALDALATTYGKKEEYSGPLYKSMKVEGNKIRLSFTHLGGGLMAKDGGKLTGFAIAGEDKHFVWADATIEGDSVVVSAPQIAHPVAVRYAWGNNPVCNLVNKAGLPAPPFRTDIWPGVTIHNK